MPCGVQIQNFCKAKCPWGPPKGIFLMGILNLPNSECENVNVNFFILIHLPGGVTAGAGALGFPTPRGLGN